MKRKSLIFAFVLFFAISCGQGKLDKEKDKKREFDFQREKQNIQNKMNLIESGMSEAQVRQIMGQPTREEKFPFKNMELPKHVDCGDCPGAKPCYIEKAVRCAVYKKKLEKDKNSIYTFNLEVYFENSNKVCCVQFSSGMQFSLSEE